MTPVEKAIEIIGSQTALARLLEIKPQSVQQWVKSSKVPAERVLDIEKATNGKVTRHQLRPDIYPDDQAA
mgnify:CR=1 FL=1